MSKIDGVSFEPHEALAFPVETAAVRRGDWQVALTPQDLQDRRVEITGPCDRKMMINALNSGAKVTLGLPIIRTSVDHGTAYDIAYLGVARLRSFMLAIEMTGRMAE